MKEKDLKDEEIKEEEKVEEVAIEPETPSAEEEVTKLNDRILRLNAEFSNYKKRTEREKSDIYKFANEKLFLELLPVIDNMERAIGSIGNAEDHKAVIEGVNLIKQSFDDFLEKHGIKEIEAVGNSFDPELHHAVLTEETDAFEEDVVMDEFQKGYILNEKVIRHSMVKVSKK